MMLQPAAAHCSCVIQTHDTLCSAAVGGGSLGLLYGGRRCSRGDLKKSARLDLFDARGLLYSGRYTRVCVCAGRCPSDIIYGVQSGYCAAGGGDFFSLLAGWVEWGIELFFFSSGGGWFWAGRYWELDWVIVGFRRGHVSLRNGLL